MVHHRINSIIHIKELGSSKDYFRNSRNFTAAFRMRFDLDTVVQQVALVEEANCTHNRIDQEAANRSRTTHLEVPISKHLVVVDQMDKVNFHTLAINSFIYQN